MFAKRFSRALVVTTAASLVLATAAFADNVANEIDTPGTILTITRGDATGASDNWKINASGGDGQSGCNASDGSAATMSFIGLPAGVTAFPAQPVFTDCGNAGEKSVNFTAALAAAAGDYAITVSIADSGPGTYNPAGGAFTLRVVDPVVVGDTTAPVISITTPADGATYLLNQVVSADYSCTDDESAVTLCEGPVADGAAIDTSSVGAKSFTVNATSSGGSSSLTHNYSVIYDFDGFFRPVDNLPALNVSKAGSAIPIKFSLNGDQGLNIMAADYPTSKVSSCETAGAPDTIEETVTAGQSSLSYDATADQYVYVWKTDKGWAGTCRTLTVKLADGTVHQALFKLTK